MNATADTTTGTTGANPMTPPPPPIDPAHDPAATDPDAPGAGNEDAGKPEKGKSKKKAKGKTIAVLVLRAVDGYHHRGVTLTVPDDEYHRGLLKQGNLREVK